MTIEREKRSGMAVRVGLAANILLAAAKTTVGIVGYSSALLADGINSTSDVAYYIVVQVFMRLARQPADEQHPYGHRQMETIAAVVVGSFVMTTGVAVFWESINRVYDLLSGPSTVVEAELIAVWVGLATVLIKIGLTVYTMRVGRRTGNLAIQALAYDHRNDIFSAAAATGGVFVSRLGYPWVDPLAGALVALVILRTGIQILRESSADLMDTVPGRPLDTRIAELALAVPGVKEVKDVRAHRFGPYLVVNITIGIDGKLSVSDGDAIASRVERMLYHSIEYLRQVHVHYHPVGAGEVEPPDVELDETTAP